MLAGRGQQPQRLFLQQVASVQEYVFLLAVGEEFFFFYNTGEPKENELAARTVLSIAGSI